MSDTDSGRPRRAVEPLGDDSDDGQGDAADLTPSRAWVASDADTTTQPSARNESGTDEPAVSTPIPPPRPALPEPPQPPESGRRFSAEPVADDAGSVAPRRSAVSVTSPPRADDAEPDGVPLDDDERDGIPADDADSERTPLGDGAEPSDAEIADAVVRPDGAKGNPKGRLWIVIGAAVAAVSMLALIVWFSGQRSATTGAPPVSSAGPVSSPSPSSSAILDEAQLLTSTDLAGLRKGLTWTQTAASAGPDTQPSCIELSSIGGATAQAEVSRHFTASKSAGALTQVTLAMADVSSAGSAYDAVVGQAAACSGAHILAAYRIEGLADATTALNTSLSDGTGHTLLLTRTGRFVNVADASIKGAAPFSVNALADALGISLKKQCGAATGTCPTDPKAAATVPPATDTVGWLAWVDLPQITPGVGIWAATDPQAPDLVGSQCEVVNLNKLPGAVTSAHRTYLLTDDSKAPEAFGLDQAVYTFGKPSAAAAMAKTLQKNFDGCGARTRTATVKNTTVSALDANGKELTATTYLVTQRISASKTVTFRVGVAAVGTRLVYLLANPSAGFDFSPDAWDAVVGRAAQRATQFA